MSNLDPLADEAVRCAVEAFVAGAFVPDFRGETVFETKNSRYRLLDGVVIAAPDESLVGAELVGWLLESHEGSVVETAWRDGARAVLVDRRRARNIVVTSTTLLRREDEPGPAPRRSAHRLERPASPPPDPAMSARRAQILSATPAPMPVVPVPPASSSEPSHPRGGVHPPPRPIAALPRPLPPPMAPPRRPSPLPPAPPDSYAVPLTRISRPAPEAPRWGEPPSEPSAWEVTSAEMEIAAFDAEAGAPASRREQHDTLEDISLEPLEPLEPESTNGAPFLLTRQSIAPSAPPPPDPQHPRPGIPDASRRR
jgi:hypothetical protein